MQVFQYLPNNFTQTTKVDFIFPKYRNYVVKCQAEKMKNKSLINQYQYYFKKHNFVQSRQVLMKTYILVFQILQTLESKSKKQKKKKIKIKKMRKK